MWQKYNLHKWNFILKKLREVYDDPKRKLEMKGKISNYDMKKLVDKNFKRQGWFLTREISFYSNITKISKILRQPKNAQKN